MRISLDIHSLFKWHLAVICLLAFGYAITIACFELFGLDHMKGLTRLFALDAEQNIPAFFSAAALAAVAAASFLSAKAFAGEANFWKPLAAAFLFLALDEAVSIHELLVPLFRQHVYASADYASAWAIPYSFGLAGFLVVLWRPFMRIPGPTRTGLIFAGCIFVSGAIGFEKLSAIVSSGTVTWTSKTLAYSLSVLGEETLEMFGIALALRIILQRLVSRTVILQVNSRHTA